MVCILYQCLWELLLLQWWTTWYFANLIVTSMLMELVVCFIKDYLGFGMPKIKILFSSPLSSTQKWLSLNCLGAGTDNYSWFDSSNWLSKFPVRLCLNFGGILLPNNSYAFNVVIKPASAFSYKKWSEFVNVSILLCGYGTPPP